MNCVNVTLYPDKGWLGLVALTRAAVKMMEEKRCPAESIHPKPLKTVQGIRTLGSVEHAVRCKGILRF